LKPSSNHPYLRGNLPRSPIGNHAIIFRRLLRRGKEARSHLSAGRVARVLFTEHEGQMALLHAFIKKSRKTPPNDLQLARRRKKLWLNELVI
jgi:phage-related protein